MAVSFLKLAKLTVLPPKQKVRPNGRSGFGKKRPLTLSAFFGFWLQNPAIFVWQLANNLRPKYEKILALPFRLPKLAKRQNG
ncbi:MAG: hypothetical protein FD128_2631, partial [Hyphomonadaceae bacterium]